jgi:hypothetical protein
LIGHFPFAKKTSTPMEDHDRAVDRRLDALESPNSPVTDAMKEAVKEALKEWLDQKFLMVGKYTVNGILAAGLAGLVYFILLHSGWKQEP